MGKVRAFFPGKKAAKKPIGEPAWAQNQTICACNLNVAKRASGHKKSLKISDKTSLFVFRQFSGFFLCALRTAGPASLACPEAVDSTAALVCACCFYGVKRRFSASLLTQKRRVSPLAQLQLAFAASTAANGVSLLLSFTQREKNLVRSSPRPIPAW